MCMTKLRLGLTYLVLVDVREGGGEHRTVASAMVLRGADCFVVVNCGPKQVRGEVRLDRSGAGRHRDACEMRTVVTSVAASSLL
jgi:hypothetical protein